jgi:hypothetical protein
MNQLSPQIQTMIRGIVKLIAGLLLAHGASKLGSALTTEPIIELIFGVVAAGYGFYSSHQKAAQIPVVAVPTGVTDASGNTQFMVKPANATITKNDPTPRNITPPALETVQTSTEVTKAA